MKKVKLKKEQSKNLRKKQAKTKSATADQKLDYIIALLEGGLNE